MRSHKVGHEPFGSNYHNTSHVIDHSVYGFDILKSFAHKVNGRCDLVIFWDHAILMVVKLDATYNYKFYSTIARASVGRLRRCAFSLKKAHYCISPNKHLCCLSTLKEWECFKWASTLDKVVILPIIRITSFLHLGLSRFSITCIFSRLALIPL